MTGLLQWLMGRIPIKTRKLTPDANGNGVNETNITENSLIIIDDNGNKKKPTLANGTRIYVVGDVHGQLESLKGVIEKIRTDINCRPTQDVFTVFIGDYIDRGLASKSVIDAIIDESGIGAKITLRGNHEEMMLRSLDDVACMKEWCAVGGVQTIFSYGVDIQDLMIGRGYDGAQAALIAALPRSHLAWLRGLSSRYENGDYFFCHAGINPDKSIDDQEDSDLLWIRHKFTDDERNYPKIIVHGHSPVERVDIRHNRINVDTGAFFTGNLSCIALERDGIVYF